MNFYKITASTDTYNTQYRGSLLAAHKEARDNIAEYHDDGTRIELVEIEVNKDSMCIALSGWGAVETVLRTWRLTPRRGLIEIKNGE